MTFDLGPYTFPMRTTMKKSSLLMFGLTFFFFSAALPLHAARRAVALTPPKTQPPSLPSWALLVPSASLPAPASKRVATPPSKQSTTHLSISDHHIGYRMSTLPAADLARAPCCRSQASRRQQAAGLAAVLAVLGLCSIWSTVALLWAALDHGRPQVHRHDDPARQRRAHPPCLAILRMADGGQLVGSRSSSPSPSLPSTFAIRPSSSSSSPRSGPSTCPRTRSSPSPMSQASSCSSAAPASFAPLSSPSSSSGSSTPSPTSSTSSSISLCSASPPM